MSSRITSEERSIGVTSNLERPIFEQATIDGAVLSDTLRVNLSTGAVTTMSPKSARISAASCFSAALDAEPTGTGAEAAMLAAVLSYRFAN